MQNTHRTTAALRERRTQARLTPRWRLRWMIQFEFEETTDKKQFFGVREQRPGWRSSPGQPGGPG